MSMEILLPDARFSPGDRVRFEGREGIVAWLDSKKLARWLVIEVDAEGDSLPSLLWVERDDWQRIERQRRTGKRLD